MKEDLGVGCGRCRCITQLMLQLRCQVHAKEMFELMKDPSFQIELVQRVAQRPLHDYVMLKFRPDSSEFSEGNDQSATGNVHGHGEEDSPGTGVDHGNDQPDISGVRDDEEDESPGTGVDQHEIGREFVSTERHAIHKVFHIRLPSDTVLVNSDAMRSRKVCCS